MGDCDNDKALLVRIEALEKLANAKFEAIHLSVDKAEKATELRFQSVNEFRQTLTDQTGTFVTREVFSDMERRMGAVENRLSVLDGRVIGWSAGVGAVVLLIALISQFLI